jgi:hypothetical protein
VSVLLGSENSFSQKLGRNRGTFMLWVTPVNPRNSFALFTSVSLSHIKEKKKKVCKFSEPDDISCED